MLGEFHDIANASDNEEYSETINGVPGAGPVLVPGRDDDLSTQEVNKVGACAVAPLCIYATSGPQIGLSLKQRRAGTSPFSALTGRLCPGCGQPQCPHPRDQPQCSGMSSF